GCDRRGPGSRRAADGSRDRRGRPARHVRRQPPRGRDVPRRVAPAAGADRDRPGDPARVDRAGRVRSSAPLLPVSRRHGAPPDRSRNPWIYVEARRPRRNFRPRRRTLCRRRRRADVRLPGRPMARVFPLTPPSPEPVKTPLLAFCHLASSLRAGGHDVALLDASTLHAPRDPEAIEERIVAFAPDVVGLHLKTLHVQPAYALAARLAARWPLVAGGPHATIRPDEPFRHGFRFVVRGEGEPTLVELADALDGRRPLD